MDTYESEPGVPHCESPPASRGAFIATVLAVLLILASVLGGCRAGAKSTPTAPLPTVVGNPVPRGNRLLGIAILPAEHEDQGKATKRALRAGAAVTPMSLFWDEVETAPHEYHVKAGWVKMADRYYPSVGMKVALTIGVLDTTADRRPPDLRGKPYDDPEVIKRFDALLDHIAARAPHLKLASLSIGNEIDGVLRHHPESWAQYAAFFQKTSAHSRSLWPGVPVGAKVMFSGAQAYPDRLRPIWNASDAVMLTYYPLNDDFTVRAPDVVAKDFDRMVDLAAGRPIYLLEAGYPSSKACDSSEEKQAEFVRQVFRAWDAHASAMPLVIFFTLTDLSPVMTRKYQGYYGVRGAAFGEFLHTLGVRTWPGNGRDKLAYRVLLAETQARGWKK